MLPSPRPRNAAALAAAVLFSMTSLAAAEGSDAALATELFNAGRDLMQAGSYATACPKLAESARLDAKVGTFARLAECEEKIGQMVVARSEWQKAANLARAQGDPRLTHVEAELARVDKIVPKVKVAVSGEVPPGLALRIDGVDLGAASVGVALPVEAGSHAVVVSAPGKKPFSTTVTTVADGRVTEVRVPPLEDAPLAPGVVLVPPPAPPVVAESPPPALGWSTMKKAGFVTMGVGVASVVVGSVFGILAKVKLDASNSDGCHDNICPQKGLDERNAAFTDGTTATALYIAGAGVVATGLSLFLLAPPASREGGASQAPRVSVGPGNVLVRGSF